MLQDTLARKSNSTTLWSDRPSQSQLLELAVSLINNECTEHAFFYVVGPFVHTEDGNDLFGF
jgi:hypothetical protein